MSGDDRLVLLPESITLTLAEARTVVLALDVGLELAAADSAAMQLLDAANRLIVAKLWPELGELLDDEEG